jgi:uncharacterized protein (TIGR02594 family)
MSEPAWLTAARSDIGNREVKPNDSPLIRRMLAGLNAMWLVGQPWCGVACAAWMQRCGIPYPAGYYRAKDWALWGVPTEPRQGAIVVFRRDGGGHVAILDAVTPDGKLVCIGGNQSDQVKRSVFDPARVLAYRWPPGIAIPAVRVLPESLLGEPLSRNEA